MSEIYPVILSGGSGVRLWPLSTKDCPKQFIKLVNEKTPFQESIERVRDPLFYSPIIIANEEYEPLVEVQLKQLQLYNYQIILEPEPKNTAPACAIAALHLLSRDPNAIMLVLPSDHMINDISAFLDSIKKAHPHAKNQKIITFGVPPDHPETAYGYIQIDHEFGNYDEAYKVQKFIEKPNISELHNFYGNQHYYWNSGIFLVSAKLYLEELKQLRVQIYESCLLTYNNSYTKADRIILDRESFHDCESDSIDYAIMEKSTCIYMIPTKICWNDLGSWNALWSIGQKDSRGNVFIGNITSNACENSYIYSECAHLVVMGFKDIIFIHTHNHILILPKSNLHQLKQLLASIEIKNCYPHPKITSITKKPWGEYEILSQQIGYKVKRLIIKPGKKTSLQSHKHRAEHWVVTNGEATVTKGHLIFKLSQNETTFINSNELHRLENNMNEELVIIEIQIGTYLEEDDITRYNDLYEKLA